MSYRAMCCVYKHVKLTMVNLDMIMPCSLPDPRELRSTNDPSPRTKCEEPSDANGHHNASHGSHMARRQLNNIGDRPVHCECLSESPTDVVHIHEQHTCKAMAMGRCARMAICLDRPAAATVGNVPRDSAHHRFYVLPSVLANEKL
jgi:hypothetical protein